MAVLTKGLQRVRAEFNDVWKNRDKATDGWVGDLRHQTSESGHNPDKTGRAEYKDGDSLDEVRAIDVDRDLVPGSKTDWMERAIQKVVTMARAGVYVPFRYIIYKGRIWSRTGNWVTRVYTGSNPHDKHAHFSGDFTQKADNWNGSLGLASLVGGGTVKLAKHEVEGVGGLTVPVLNVGDNDRKFEGYWGVLRLQRLLGMGVEDQDGIFGKGTQSKLKGFMVAAGHKKHTGTRVGRTEWSLLMGLSPIASS